MSDRTELLVSVFILILSGLHSVISFDSSNVVFIVISQPEPYHASVAARLKSDIQNQLLEIEKKLPRVHLTHEDMPIMGGWTIHPLLPDLYMRYGGGDVRWIVFLEPHTSVRCKLLLDVLASADRNPMAMWVGYPLSDEEPIIIHHFKFYEELDEKGGFIFPYFAAGFAIRTDLIQKLLIQIQNEERILDAEFSIDPAFELAQLIYGSKEDPGPLVTPEQRFCVVSAENCATYPRQYDICGSAIAEDSIFFAVKTWSGFHATRAHVVKKTWGKYVTNLHFFSDTADPSLPSINIGIPNTKSGHCAKTVAILRHVTDLVNNKPNIKWIFLADDDTIFSVHRLCEALSCLRGGDELTVFGERYGYGYGKKETAAKGYDFITGGGGTAMSVGAARLLSRCSCAAPAAPDDMTLGACARFAHNISLTHSPLFHQNRPQDYSREYLARDRPVSFHRHSSPEPLRVYANWFHRDDLNYNKKRDEL